MDFGWLLLFGLFWIVFRVLREGTETLKRGPRPPEGQSRPRPADLRDAFAETSPGLRALLDAIEQAAAPPGTRPPPALPRREQQVPDDFTSLESAGDETIVERAPERVPRKDVDLDEESIAVAQKRRALADRIDVPARSTLRRAGPAPEPEVADATSVAMHFPSGSLRQAMIWQEILAPPRALRDG